MWMWGRGSCGNPVWRTGNPFAPTTTSLLLILLELCHEFHRSWCSYGAWAIWKVLTTRVGTTFLFVSYWWYCLFRLYKVVVLWRFLGICKSIIWNNCHNKNVDIGGRRWGMQLEVWWRGSKVWRWDVMSWGDVWPREGWRRSIWDMIAACDDG